MTAFTNIYRHGFARISAFAPEVHLADPLRNAETLIGLVRTAHERHAAVALFPELGLTGYSVDDLHHQSALLDASEAAAARIIEASEGLRPLIFFGCALRSAGQLFNCALAVQNGQLLGVVPKSYLPNYREFYEKRWFADSSSVIEDTISVGDHVAPFGTDLLFEALDAPGLVVHAEICEDFWSPIPPSLYGALAGATVMVNLSASNATIGKARERAALCDAQSRRTQGAYIFSAAGTGESTTDLAWDGQLLAYQQGDLIAEGERFLNDAPATLFADIDLDRITSERARLSTWRDACARHVEDLRSFSRIGFTLDPDLETDIPLQREIARFPFVPNDAARLDEDCYEAYNIQVQGLVQRLKATGIKTAVIGVSGGLDSTQALIITARAFDRLGLDRSGILAVTLPGFATSAGTRSNALALIEGLGATHREIDIKPAAERMLADLDHPYSDGASQYDITFENVQAGLRTDYLFRLANHEGGLVIGTGDLSELALGWCTYGVGDHMSHYNVNGGVAKTLIQHLIGWAARREEYGAAVSKALLDVLNTEISPELIPAGEDGAIQSTEDAIGPYPLNDFFLHYVVRHGFSPAKIAFLAAAAWSNAETGHWPPHVSAADKRAFDRETILHWLGEFARRFFGSSQFKRSAVPNGPKLTSAGALSPRGDWRMPSDSSAKVWRDAVAALKDEIL